MGFLNNTTVTVDAILTKKGRELLAQGTEAFNITKFALADDEVDYGLWDVTHPNGTDYYGKVIENMPLLEALRYKLVTLPKATIKMPVISVDPESITFVAGNRNQLAKTVTADTANVTDNSYTFILHDRTIATMTVLAAAGDGGPGATTPFFLGEDDAPNSLTMSAKSVSIGIQVVDKVKATQLTIIGNDTGATSTITINNKLTLASLMNQ